jgi:crotonobetaine/carnitine-CoA ligase
LTVATAHEESAAVLDRNCLPPHAVARWAASDPDRVAVQHVDGPALTYAELHTAGLRWAAALARLGVEAGHHVGTMLPNGFDPQQALLGTSWLRVIEVPVAVGLQGSLLHRVLDHADVTTLVVAAELVERLVPLAPRLPSLRTVVVLDGPEGPGSLPPLPFRVVTRAELLDGVEPAEGLAGPEYHDVAALLFTSGTTGPSKAVVAPWGLVYQFWSWVPEDTVLPGEGFFCALPLFHNSGRSGITTAWARGARFCFRERFSAAHFWEDVRRTESVVAALVGPLTSLLWSAEPRPDDADNPLRSVIVGPMIPEIEEFGRRFGVAVATSYGQTEIGCSIVTTWDHGPWDTCGRRRESYPWPEVRIVDELDQPVPTGVVGEMVVRSAEPWSLNAGYYKAPEETAAAWRNGWFHTGDALRVDADGWYTFVDRMRDSIRRRGENISSFEVEQLVAEHPDVLECAAIGIRTVHGDDDVMVALIVRDPATFDPAALLDDLEARMPRFMLPRFVEVVDDLPRNENTLRVRKHELRARGVGPTAWDREAAGPAAPQT